MLIIIKLDSTFNIGDRLKNALDKLCNSLDEFELTLSLLDKYNDLKVVSKNLHNVQIYQLDELRKGSWFFNYYDFNDIKQILDITYNKIKKY